MRRMMHALIAPLLLTSYTIAQDLPGVPLHEPPAVVSSPTDVVLHNSPADFYPVGGDQPYSSLATYMYCHNNCKDFWAGYSAERAAIAARLCRDCTHGHRCGCHGCGAACGNSACATGPCASGIGIACDSQASNHIPDRKAIAVNRYRPGWSSLYSEPGTLVAAAPGQLDGQVSVARRTVSPQATQSPAKMSLVVTNRSTTERMGGNSLPSADSTRRGGDRPVISPYLKATSNSQTVVPTAAQSLPYESVPAVHRSATLPPSNGNWAR